MSDPGRIIASPLPAISADDALRRIKSIVEDEGVAEVVVGVPLHMDGRMSEMGEEATSFVSQLRSMLEVPVFTADERMSTIEAQRSLDSTESPSRRRSRDKGRVDSAAAAIILQAYLDSAG